MFRKLLTAATVALALTASASAHTRHHHTPTKSHQMTAAQLQDAEDLARLAASAKQTRQDVAAQDDTPWLRGADKGVEVSTWKGFESYQAFAKTYGDTADRAAAQKAELDKSCTDMTCSYTTTVDDGAYFTTIHREALISDESNELATLCFGEKANWKHRQCVNSKGEGWAENYSAKAKAWDQEGDREVLWIADTVKPADSSIAAKCLLKVDGKTIINGRCSYNPLDKDGSFQISEARSDGYFAYVNVTEPKVATGTWSGTRGAGHATDDMGTLVQHGACWKGDSTEVCVWKL